MNLKTSIKIGPTTYQFEFTEPKEMDTLNKAIVLSNPLRTCDNCNDVGYDNKYLTSNKDTEGNTYVNCKCAKCGATSKLGLYKSGGYFWHKYEVYVSNKTEEK